MKRYENFWHLMCDIRENKKNYKILLTTQFKELRLGWTIDSPEQELYVLPTYLLKNYQAIQLPSPFDSVPIEIIENYKKKLLELIVTEDTRSIITKYLNDEIDIPEFSIISNKLNNMKAFW